MPIPKPNPFSSGATASMRSWILRIALVVIVVLIFGRAFFVQVGPGQRGVLMNFGAIQNGVLAPGIHWRWPIVQTVKLIDVRIQKSEEDQTAASKDLQDVTTKVAVNWSIDPQDAQWVYQQIGDEPALVEKVIEPAIANAVKAVTAQYNAEDLVEKRNLIRKQIGDQVVTTMIAYKVKVEAVNITNFAFSPEYRAAIEAKQVAQQHAQQAEYDLQRVKVEAQQRVADAQGQSQAQQLMQATLTNEFIEYQAVQKWNGVLPLVMSPGALPMFDLGAAMQKSTAPANK